MKTLKELIKEGYPNYNTWFAFHNLLQEKIEIEAFAKWLGEHRHPLLPYPGGPLCDMTKEEWDWREINRQNQIDELLTELGFTKFDVIPIVTQKHTEETK